MIEHGSSNYWERFGHFSSNVCDIGRFGITLFFLASGFIIPVSIERSRSLRRFWRSRFFRLWPLYWVSLIAVLLLSTVKPEALNYAHRSVTNAVVNATMFQEFVGVPHAIQLYYTLTIELVFYVACTVLFALGWLRRSVMLSAVSIIAVFVLGTVAPLALHHRTPMLGLFALASMFFGTVLYRYVQGEVSKRTVAALFVAVFIVAIPGTYMNYVRYQKSVLPWDRHTFSAEYVPWVLAYLVFFGALALRRYEFPSPMVWLGRISYSVYLMHPLLLSISIGWLTGSAGLAFLVFSTLALATVTYHLVEKPSIDFGRRLSSLSSRTTVSA